MDAVLFQKFRQGPQDWLKLLLSTRDRLLFECTKGKCWGVGLIEQDARRVWWRGGRMLGNNLHGICLMHVRDIFRGRLHRAHWVVGDSITANTASEGVFVLTLSGACIARVAKMC